MSVEITEFVEIDPDSVHAVYKAANGTPFLMIKQVDDGDDDKSKPDGDEDDKAEKMEFCGDVTCEVCLSRAAKGKLSMAARRKIPKGDFAIPDKAPESGSYPINDKAHARNALSRVSQHGTPEEKARVRRAVASKFPGIGKSKKKSKKAMAGQQEVEQTFHGVNPSPDAQMGQTKTNKRGLATNKDVVSNRPDGQPKKLDGGNIKAEGVGFGDTAPDKDLHEAEATTQGHEREAAEDARQNASKEIADMKGDHIEKSPEEGATASGTQSQTEANMRRHQSAGEAELPSQKGEGIKAFKFKVKKGGKKKKKKNAPLEISGAMKQSEPDRVVSWPHATKELESMTVNEFAEAFNGILDKRDALKAAEEKARKKARKAKAKKAKKAEALKAAAATVPGGEEAARDAAKSITPEKLVEGIGATVEAALKESLAPLFGRMNNLENQPARPRLAINSLAGKDPVMRDQQNPGSNPMDFLKPLEDAFKSEKDPYKREKMGGELTKARLVVRERLAHGQPVSQADAAALAAVAAR